MVGARCRSATAAYRFLAENGYTKSYHISAFFPYWYRSKQSEDWLIKVWVNKLANKYM